MRTPRAAAALLLLLCSAVPAPAQKAAPGTATPHSSGTWGKDEAETRRLAAELFARLLAEAAKGVKVGDAVVVYAGAPALKIDLTRQSIDGSPAAAFQAGIGYNKSGPYSGADLVYAATSLFEIADPDEAAMFLAHEIGHLAYGHPKKQKETTGGIVDRLYDEWRPAHEDALRRVAADPRWTTEKQRADASVAVFIKDVGPKLEKELAAMQQPDEDQADRYARALALQVNPNAPDASVTAFKRAQDWLWALHYDLNDANHDGTVADRAAKNEKWLAERRAAAERAETARRRAEGAARGMSVP